MGKATAREIRDLYQKRFDKTAAYAAQLLCDGLDKKLRAVSEASAYTIAQHTIQIRELLPENYVLPKGMLQWRFAMPEKSKNSKLLSQQIVLLVQQYYADWHVKLMYDHLDFQDNVFVFDAKYVAEVKIPRPEDFDFLFTNRMCDMIQYFVREIRKKIDACYGKQSTKEPIITGTILYPEQLSLGKENAKNIFQAVKNNLKEDGWSVSIKTSKPAIDTLYPNASYNFVISPL